MAITPNATGEGKKIVMDAKRGCEEGAKYTRYTKQQIEVLEKVYAEFPNLNCSQRTQILLEQLDLNGIDNKKLKVWFQNRRCHDNLKKEKGDLLEEKKKLALANMNIKAKNDVLQNMVAELPYDSEYLQN